MCVYSRVRACVRACTCTSLLDNLLPRCALCYVLTEVFPCVMASRPPETLLRHPSVAASQHRSIPASQHAADGKLHPRAKCFWEAATRPCLAHAREMRAPLGLIQRPPHPPSKKVTSESSRMSADGTVAFSFEKRIFCVGSSLVTHTSQLSWAHTGSGARAHARTGRLDCAPKHMLLLHARCACVRRPCLCSATRCLAHVCVCVCTCAAGYTSKH